MRDVSRYEFRPVTESDLARIARWCSSPQVVRWWGPPDVEDAAETLATEQFASHAAKLDQNEPHLVDGRVELIPEVKAALDAYREGGFMVEFLPDFSEGNGRWWYTRIGSDYAPAQEGGRFHLVRKSLSARVSAKPADP